MTPETIKLIITYIAPAVLVLILVWKIFIPIVTVIGEIIKVTLQIFHEILLKVLALIRRKDPDPKPEAFQ